MGEQQFHGIRVAELGSKVERGAASLQQGELAILKKGHQSQKLYKLTLFAASTSALLSSSLFATPFLDSRMAMMRAVFPYCAEK